MKGARRNLREKKGDLALNKEKKKKGDLVQPEGEKGGLALNSAHIAHTLV